MDKYQLIDSGDFSKLERIGPVIVSRPAPGAVWSRSLPAANWNGAELVYHRHSGGTGEWRGRLDWLEKSIQIALGHLTFELKFTDFGHLGLFPEQADNWKFIEETVGDHMRREGACRVLNLFAYTGGSSLAAARAGAQVTHVDASKTSVAWARDNAKACGLADAPIRWICEDVQKFVARELKRGKVYDGIILDPPSFGRGTKKEVWKIESDLVPLLKGLSEVCSDKLSFVILSSHSAGYGPLSLQNLLKQDMGLSSGSFGAFEMAVPAINGPALPSGFCARWSRHASY